MTRIRVTHLVSGDLWAGAEVATFHVLRALAARDDVEVSAVVLNPGELHDRLAAAGVPVTLEPEKGRGFATLSRALASRLAGADLVHAHRYKEDLLAARSGRPWIATQHGRPEPFGGPAGARMAAYLLADLAAKRFSARAVVAVSEEVAAWLRPRVGARRVVLAANGIADPAPGGAAAPWSARPRRVGVLARLVPVKDVGLAIDAVSQVPGVALEIVGDGPERAHLERHAAASGAGDRIVFAGFDPKPLARVAGWRALLVTSRHEGHPIGVLEAMALGTPVLHVGLAGVTEILAGRGGAATPERSPAALAAALRRLLDDEAAGAAMSAAARARFLDAFTADRAAERLAALYRDVSGTGSPR